MASDSLTKSTVSGLRWLALNSAGGEIIGVSSTIVLARLIPPAEFGHAAVAFIFGLLAVMLTFEGFAAALVQRSEVTERHRQVAVLLSWLGGLVLGAIALVSAPLLWRPIFGAETARLVALTSASFPLASLGAVSRATLWRNLDFRRVTQTNLAGGLGGSLVSVVLAILHFGGAALVLGGVASITLVSLLLLIMAPAPIPRWHRQEAHDVVGYGVFTALAALVAQLFSNVDYWIVAARLSAYQAGIYYRAFNTGVVYQTKISNVMMQLAFPVYSRVENRDEMRRLHERAARVHAVIIFPLLALLVVLAPVAVPFVFGSAWRPAVRPTEILAVAGMVAAILTGFPQVMQAVGRPRALLIFNVFTLVIYGTAVAIAAGYGLIAVAIAVVTVYMLVLVAAYQFLLKPNLGLSLGRLIPEMAPAVTGCGLLIAVCEPLRVLLESRVPAPATVALVAASGLVLYGLVLRLVFRPAWRDLYALVVKAVPQVVRIRAGVARVGVLRTSG